MEDSRQDLRTERRGGGVKSKVKSQKAKVKTAERSGRQTMEEDRPSSDGVVGFGRIWPRISGGGRTEDGRWRSEDRGRRMSGAGVDIRQENRRRSREVKKAKSVKAIEFPVAGCSLQKWTRRREKRGRCRTESCCGRWDKGWNGGCYETRAGCCCMRWDKGWSDSCYETRTGRCCGRWDKGWNGGCYETRAGCCCGCWGEDWSDGRYERRAGRCCRCWDKGCIEGWGSPSCPGDGNSPGRSQKSDARR
jgi:hypothetical protein